MPRSCPPLRSDEVGWHGRRVRTRLRLILERVFWFVNGGLSRMFVGGAAFAEVPDRGRGRRVKIQLPLKSDLNNRGQEAAETDRAIG